MMSRVLKWHQIALKKIRAEGAGGSCLCQLACVTEDLQRIDFRWIVMNAHSTSDSTPVKPLLDYFRPTSEKQTGSKATLF